MSTQPTTPQLQHYKKQGPDGKWYQTQASSPDEAKAKLAQAMQPQNDPTKNYGFTTSNIRKNVGEGLKQVYQGTKEMGKTLLNPKTSGNVNRALDQFVFKPGDEQLRKAKEDFNNKRLLESAGHFIAAGIPFLGPAAAGIGEQAGTGDVGGAGARGAAMIVAGKAGELVGKNVSKAASDTLDPAALRTRAAALDTKVLKTADAGAKGYKTSVGLQTANEGIVGTMKQLPNKIELARSAKQAKVEALAKYHDGKGTVVDAEQGLAPMLRNTAQRLNAQGLLTGSTRAGVQSLLKRITTKWDFQTGKEVPRDLKKLKVSEALELSKGLEDLSAFGKVTPREIEVFARQLRQVINDSIDKVDPEIGKTRAEQSRLITARDAAREHYAKMLNDKVGLARGIMYSNAPTIGVWLGLRALGLMTPVTALGSVILLKTLAESALSRTARAALYAKAADIMERTVGQGATPPNAASAPSGPGMGQGPTLGPGGPQRAANAPTATSTAPRGGLPPMPPASADVTRPRTPAIAESATRARAGSGDYVKASKPTAEPAVVARPNAARSSTTSPAKPPQTKAMLDRLDALLERKPKSGAENNAIKREINEIKQLLTGKATAGEQSAINKRIADRERLASKRASASSQQTGTPTSASGEAVSQTASPEMRAIALDAGYKALIHYEGGPEMVKALRNTAKAMQKIDPSYDEVEKLTEALQILKQVSGDLDTGKK